MQLNPCPNPFCNQPNPDLTKSKLKHNREKPWFIWCGACENEMGGYESKKAAIDGWNNYKAAARAEALKDAVKKIKGEWFKIDIEGPMKKTLEEGFRLGIRAAVDTVEDLAKGEDSG